MKVKLNTIMAGPDISAGIGEIVDLDPALAKALIKEGYAALAEQPEVVADPKEPPVEEQAVLPAPENAAVKKKGK